MPRKSSPWLFHHSPSAKRYRSPLNSLELKASFTSNRSISMLYVVAFKPSWAGLRPERCVSRCTRCRLTSGRRSPVLWWRWGRLSSCSRGRGWGRPSCQSCSSPVSVSSWNIKTSHLSYFPSRYSSITHTIALNDLCIKQNLGLKILINSFHKRTRFSQNGWNTEVHSNYNLFFHLCLLSTIWDSLITGFERDQLSARNSLKKDPRQLHLAVGHNSRISEDPFFLVKHFDILLAKASIGIKTLGSKHSSDHRAHTQAFESYSSMFATEETRME